MSRYPLKIQVGFKEGILDPEAEAIKAALSGLEFESINSFRCEKTFLVEIEAKDSDEAIQAGKQMAEKLLANPVMEDFQVELSE